MLRLLASLLSRNTCSICMIRGMNGNACPPETVIVSASRSPPGLDSKVSTFGAHFRLAPKRVDFWGSFSHSGGSFVSFLAHFSNLGSTLAALGAHFFITKTVWTTKGAPIGISPKMASIFWSHFGVVFCDFLNLLSSVFKHRFWLSSEADFSWISVSFRHIFFVCFWICPHLWF